MGAVDVYTAAMLSKGQAWKLDAVALDVMNFTAGAWKDPNSVPTLEQTKRYNTRFSGLRYSIDISRSSS